jgi:hypothetical protein
MQVKTAGDSTMKNEARLELEVKSRATCGTMTVDRPMILAP